MNAAENPNNVTMTTARIIWRIAGSIGIWLSSVCVVLWLLSVLLGYLLTRGVE
jgi:hypothetical protein